MRIDDEPTTSRLRDVVQDSHINFLMGAGTPSAMFKVLGDIEAELTKLDASEATSQSKSIARASIYAYFFDEVIWPNKFLLDGHNVNSRKVLTEYEHFLRTIHQILLNRRSSLLNKQVNIFTTNVDLAFEVALEELGVESNDGFAGKLLPQFDTNNYGSLRFKQSVRYEKISEVPTFNLMKLHGSVGWEIRSDQTAESNSVIVFDVKIGLLDVIQEKLEEARASLIPIGEESEKILLQNVLANADFMAMTDSVSDFLVAYEKLAIVNPTKEKFQITVLNQIYYELLRIFANNLEIENSVLFVHGFSFRDEHIRQMVLRAAGSNPTLQVMVFCYTVADRDAYLTLMPSQLVKNNNINYLVPQIDIDGREISSLDLETITAKYFAPLVYSSIAAHAAFTDAIGTDSDETLNEN